MKLQSGLAALCLALALAGPARAAEFVVEALSDAPICDHPFILLSGTPGCIAHLPATVRVTITPAPGELPVKCQDDGAGGSFCLYAASLYVAGYYRGQWYAKQGYGWKLVDDVADMTPVTAWPPWSGMGSFTYDVSGGSVDLETSRALPPPEGAEMYVTLVPVGSKIFSAGLTKKVYPVFEQ